MDAEAVVGDLLHNNIINEGAKRDITSTRDPRLQNQELHLCLKKRCTPDALMTVCDIMMAVGGNPNMLALGEAIKRKLVTGVCVCVCVRVCVLSGGVPYDRLMVQPLIDCIMRVIGRLAVRAVELPVDAFSLTTGQRAFW